MTAIVPSANTLKPKDLANPQRTISRRDRKITSCTYCRDRKIKCDKGHPCSRCQVKGLECLYITNPLEYLEKAPKRVVKKRNRRSKTCVTCRFKRIACDQGVPCLHCQEYDLNCVYKPYEPTRRSRREASASTMVEANDTLPQLNLRLQPSPTIQTPSSASVGGGHAYTSAYSPKDELSMLHHDQQPQRPYTYSGIHESKDTLPEGQSLHYRRASQDLADMRYFPLHQNSHDNSVLQSIEPSRNPHACGNESDEGYGSRDVSTHGQQEFTHSPPTGANYYIQQPTSSSYSTSPSLGYSPSEHEGQRPDTPFPPFSPLQQILGRGTFQYSDPRTTMQDSELTGSLHELTAFAHNYQFGDTDLPFGLLPL